MKILFSEKAEKELEEMDNSLRIFFIKHAEKIAEMPPKRHLRFGVQGSVEEVTKQARIVYNIEEQTQTGRVLHCFKTHKDYERWYKSFK